MPNEYDRIYDTLGTLNYEVAEQGSYDEDEELDDTLITYQFISDDSGGHYDNASTKTKLIVQVTLYSRDPSITHNGRATLDNIMLPAGYLRIGGRSLPYNKTTRHFAYSCDYREIVEEE